MKVFNNFLYNAGYQILIIIVPIIVSPYVSRVIGPSGVGTYSYTYSIISVFGIFANLGILKYGNREISNCRDNRSECSKIFTELMSVKLAASFVVFAVFICYVQLFSGEYKTLFLQQIPLILSYVLDVTWVFWGMQEFRITTVVNSILKIFTIFLIFGFVKDEGDTGIYIFILSFSIMIAQGVMWFFLPKYIDVKVSLRCLFNRHWKNMVLLFFPVLARYLYVSMDKIMLGGMAGMKEAGYYENVQSISMTMVSILTALGDVIMPQMTLLFAQKKEKEAKKLFYGSFHLITFLAFGIMYGLIGAASVFIPWFYGESFIPSVPLLQMIAPLIILSGYSDLIRNVFLIPRYKDKEYIIALAGGAGVNFLINSALIPQIGSKGAVIGTLSAELCVLVVQTIFVQNKLKVSVYLRKAFIYCTLGLTILFPCHIINQYVDTLLLAIILDVFVGGAVYVCCILVYIRLFERDIYNAIVWNVGVRTGR